MYISLILSLLRCCTIRAFCMLVLQLEVGTHLPPKMVPTMPPILWAPRFGSDDIVESSAIHAISVHTHCVICGVAVALRTHLGIK